MTAFSNSWFGRNRSIAAAILAAVWAFAAPATALACPVCFGASDSPAAQGVNMAIFFLLGVTGFVLAGFAAFIIYLMRRARMFRQGQDWDDDMVESRV